ncbi:MAG TPA: hypothetical protein VHC69_18315 [Polyangiaceae bacterium]|nr:hypothetical protein [Polyangiaceae bacterium]
MKPLASGLCCLLLASACGDGGSHFGGGTTEVVTAGQGTLVVDWTIDGSKDPGECQQGAATALDVTVQSSSGESHEYQADCDAFSTSIDLPPDSYTATAVLIDGAGDDRTTPIDIDTFHVHDGEVFTTPIDFPAGSFR